MHGHSGVEVRGRPADILRVSPVGETLIAGLSGACLHPLSLLGSPLIFFFSFFLFLIQGLTISCTGHSVSHYVDLQLTDIYLLGSASQLHHHAWHSGVLLASLPGCQSK